MAYSLWPIFNYGIYLAMACIVMAYTLRSSYGLYSYGLSLGPVVGLLVLAHHEPIWLWPI